MIGEMAWHKGKGKGQTSRATTSSILALSLLPSNSLSFALELFPVLPILLFPFLLFVYFLGSLGNSNLRAFLL
jgi:hypothetical protein